MAFINAKPIKKSIKVNSTNSSSHYSDQLNAPAADPQTRSPACLLELLRPTATGPIDLLEAPVYQYIYEETTRAISTGYCAYALAGMADEARKVVENWGAGWSSAVIYTGLGDKDQAFEGLEKAYEYRTEQLIFLKVDPYWDILRADPRFSALLAKMGFE